MIEEQYSISRIAEILAAKAFLPQPETIIRKLLTDSRTVIDPDGSLFFAVDAQRNGHQFIGHAYENGVRNFVVSDSALAEKFKDANFLQVNDVLQALQGLATYNRKANDFTKEKNRNQQLKKLETELGKNGFNLTFEVAGHVIRHPKKRWWARIELLTPHHVRIKRLRRLTIGERSRPSEVGPKKYTNAEVEKFRAILDTTKQARK